MSIDDPILIDLTRNLDLILVEPDNRVDQTGMLIPTDPVPFNEMAKLFGSAGTALTIGPPKALLTIPELQARVQTVFPGHSQELKRQIVELIITYYSTRPDHSAWEAAFKAKTYLEESGQAGGSSGLDDACGKAHRETGVDADTIKDLVRSRFYHNQR